MTQSFNIAKAPSSGGAFVISLMAQIISKSTQAKNVVLSNE